jgi:hypothetical protein
MEEEDDVFKVGTRYEVCGRLAEGHTLKFAKFKGEKNEGWPETDDSFLIETLDSLEEAKQKVLSDIEEGQISQGIVVDTETEKIVWLTKEK